MSINIDHALWVLLFFLVGIGVGMFIVVAIMSLSVPVVSCLARCLP